MIKKILVIFSLIIISMNLFSQSNYTINDNAKNNFISWYTQSGYWNNVYWYSNWSDLSSWQTWMITDYKGYDQVKDIISKPVYNDMFNDLNNSKNLGTLTTDAINNFYDTLFGDIVSSNTTSTQPQLGNLPLDVNVSELFLIFLIFILPYIYLKLKHS